MSGPGFLCDPLREDEHLRIAARLNSASRVSPAWLQETDAA